MAPKIDSVEDEYEKNKELKREDIESLRNWISKQPHLPQITDLQLIWFLHSCYYLMEPTKVTIDNFFTIRTHCSELFGCPTDSELKEAFAVVFAGYLPKRTPEGYAVQLCKMVDSNPEKYDSVLGLKLLNVVAILHLCQEGTDNGILAVIDMKGTSLGHLGRINVTAIRKGLYHVQEASPVRIKGVHFININPYTDMLVSVVKPFMKKHVLQWLFFHQDLQSLYEHVPKECLPAEYGGPSTFTMGDFISAQKENVFSNLHLLKSLDMHKVDESKRPGKPKSVNEIFGVEGSFRKLDFD